MACLTIVRCCFKELTLQQGFFKYCLEFISKQMLINKHWAYQLYVLLCWLLVGGYSSRITLFLTLYRSALDILRMFLRLKVSGVSSSILTQYIDSAVEVLYNTPLSVVKVGALEFLEAALFVFPKGISYKLEEVRDLAR